MTPRNLEGQAQTRQILEVQYPPPKFNSEFTPEKLPFHPIGKDGKACLPTILFSGVNC